MRPSAGARTGRVVGFQRLAHERSRTDMDSIRRAAHRSGIAVPTVEGRTTIQSVIGILFAANSFPAISVFYRYLSVSRPKPGLGIHSGRHLSDRQADTRALI